MKKRIAESLPVAMYHYVNRWPGGITLSPERFEDHCRALAERGWRGVGLEEAESFLIEGENLPERSFLFTFDDGFLDNYLYAQPLLHRYGHKGVVFAVSSRLESDGEARVPLDDALAGAAPVPPEVERPERITAQGFAIREDVFVNHAEARLMDERGILKLASHSRGHFGVFTGPEYTGFVKPGDCSRTFFRTEQEPVFGMPDFSVKAGLAYRAFLPDPELVRAVGELVPQTFDDAADFFADPAGEAALRDLAGRFAGRMGRFETDDERRDRMWRELSGGKSELEGILGRKVKSLCWPWGHFCDAALALAREAGFSLFFTIKEGVNLPGRPEAVHRFKGKDKNGAWLASRAWLYSRPLMGALYARFRI